MTTYDHEGLRVELTDDDAVVIYVEGVLYVEMTRGEWLAISEALEAAK